MNGQALLAGLLRCRRCASKLTVHYTGNWHDALRYACHRGWLDKGDRVVSRSVARRGRGIAEGCFSVVQPAAIEAAMVAHEEDPKQDEVLAALERDLQAAAMPLIERRTVRCCDPENRLVADELERRWNHALAARARSRDAYRSNSAHSRPDAARPAR